MLPRPHCFLRSNLLAAHGVTGIFSLRPGGVSPPPFASLNLASDPGDDEKNVTRNMDILIRRAALPCMPHRAVQVHGANILTCRDAGRMHHHEADILIGVGQTAVAVRVADCVPVLLADPAADLIAAVHAGWRGTVLRAVIHAIKAMQTHGARVDRIIASIGPCIRPCCFETARATAEKLARCCDDASTAIEYVNGEPHADLAGINRLQLMHTGIPAAHIEQSGACTCCDAERFYSWRRDGNQAGRHLAIVALPGDS